MISLILSELFSQMKTEVMTNDKHVELELQKLPLNISSVATGTALFSSRTGVDPIDMLGTTLKRYIPEATRHYPMLTDQMDMELLDWVTGITERISNLPLRILLPFVLAIRKNGDHWLTQADLISTYARTDEDASDILTILQITALLEKSELNIEIPTKVEKLCEQLYNEQLIDAMYVAYDALLSDCFRDTMKYLREQENIYAMFLGSYWFELLIGLDSEYAAIVSQKLKVSHPGLWGIIEEHYREFPVKMSHPSQPSFLDRMIGHIK